VIRFDWKRQ